MEDIILLGAGGHAKSVIDVIESESRFQIVGILDVREKVGQSCSGYEIIGTDQDLDKLIKSVKYFHVSIGHMPYQNIRANLFQLVKEAGGLLPSVISPNAIVSNKSNIGEGSIIMHGAMVNANAHIGSNCIINSKALIEHDAVVGNHVHIATGAIVNGDVKIKNSVFMGSGSIVNQSIEIGAGVVIASGAVVISDVKEGALVAGSPAVEKAKRNE